MGPILHPKRNGVSIKFILIHYEWEVSINLMSLNTLVLKFCRVNNSISTH